MERALSVLAGAISSPSPSPRSCSRSTAVYSFSTIPSVRIFNAGVSGSEEGERGGVGGGVIGITVAASSVECSSEVVRLLDLEPELDACWEGDRPE